MQGWNESSMNVTIVESPVQKPRPERGFSFVSSPVDWAKTLSEHRQVVDASGTLGPTITLVAQSMRHSLENGGKILACGNGGSHAHAQHLVAELVVRYRTTRAAMAAIALGSNPAVATATINDLTPTDIFAREVAALIRPNDVLVGISTSGTSVNVCRALDAAQNVGAITIGLTGRTGMAAPVTHEIRVPSTNTARIQEMHTLIIHAICEALNA